MGLFSIAYVLSYISYMKEETKQKLREASKRQFADPEVRKAASEKQKQLWQDPEYRIKMTEAARNKPPVRESTRAKNSAAHKGRKRPIETGKKISEAAKKRWASYSPEERRRITSIGIDKIPNGLKASLWLTYSDEQKAKIMAPAMKAAAEFWESLTPEQQAKRMANLGKRNRSSLEVAVGKVLDSLGIVYEHNHPLPPYVVDFFIPDKNLVIEADGWYWHRPDRPGQAEYEAKRDAYIVSLGYSVVHLPERQIRDSCFEIVSALVVA